MPSTIWGLPLHPLIVHATVVFVPLAVATVLGAVLVPRFRAWAGPLPAALSLVALVLTPLSTSTGENLQASLPQNSLIEEHAELGDQLVWFTLPLFLLAAGFWWLDRRRTAAGRLTGPGADTRDRSRTVTAVIGVLAVLAALGTGVQVARIGHSGAKAAWSGTGTAQG
jgi:hypothetical protein